jgi:hypothetical protein
VGMALLKRDLRVSNQSARENPPCGRLCGTVDHCPQGQWTCFNARI